MTSERTKLVTSMRGRPHRASRLTSSILSAVATIAGSFCSPSRGPTSRIVAWGTSMRLRPQTARDHHLLDLVGPLADREDLRVAVHPADRVFLDVAVSAVDLHR